MGSGRRKRKRHAQEMQRRAEIQKAEETKAAASEAAPES
jgi:hypothetical protein